MQRPRFESVQAYGSCFTDPVYWRPYIDEVGRRHQLDHWKGVRSGLPGSHPVFLIGDHYVVKFFSDLFGGVRSFAVERELYSLLEQIPKFPAPRLVAEGELFASDEGWRWPYLVSTLLPGVSLGEVYDQISEGDRAEVARYLGHWVARVHSLRPVGSSILRADWEPFCAWLAKQREMCVANHRRWQSLPARLIDQLDDYLPGVETLIDRSTEPLLLHCDLNADHLLGTLRAGSWTSSGLIDFGDARMGNLLYELVALHLGLFRYDVRLLRILLQAYGSEVALQPEFAIRAMSFTLLHEFNVLDSLSDFLPELDDIRSLAELADRIWMGSTTPANRALELRPESQPDSFCTQTDIRPCSNGYTFIMINLIRFRSCVRAAATSLLGASACLAVAAALMFRTLPAPAQTQRPAQSDEQKVIEQKLGGLRGLSDDERAKVTRQLALDIRQLPQPAVRVQLASGLANLATEGDFGHDTLQEVATTLASALKAQPVASNGAQPDYSYVTLAQLVRYENVKVSLDSPQFAAAMSKLEADDQRRQQADFTLTDLQGRPWTLKALRGKVVLVNFWATWCPPCRKEIPDLETLYNRFKDRGFVILGISDEAATKVQPYVAQHEMTYPVLLDPGRKVNELFEIQGIPRSIIYDRKGKLAAEAIDMRTQRQLLALLARAGLH